jgi:hypothetical protein
MLELWHFGDSNDLDWKRDFNSGQEIGATIILLIAAILGMISSLAFALGLMDPGAEPDIWFP